MSTRYILAHDIGTSGNKATLFTTNGELISSETYTYKTNYVNKNWVEQNPNDWWMAIVNTTQKLIQNINPKQIISIALSGQMMGCLCVDQNGIPLKNAIIHSDRRALQENNDILKNIGQDGLYKITGHKASPNYPIGKLMWIKNHEPHIYRNTYKMLNSKDYIAFKLTGNMITDYTDASSTNVFDITNKKWSDKLIDITKIDGEKLPEVKKSTSIVGEVTKKAAEITGLKVNTPVVIGAGDGMCATIGANCISPGLTYNYIGSSSWITTTTKKPIFDEKMRLETWIHPISEYYNVGGTMQTAGASFDWLVDELYENEEQGEIKPRTSSYETVIKKILHSSPGAGGVIFLPYLLGERSPHWNPNAKGAFIGLSMLNSKEDIFRSVLEGVGYNLNNILKLFQKHINIDSISLIGGGAQGDVWSQILSDIFNIRVSKPKYLTEATSLGAAVIGGVGVGEFNDFGIVKQFNSIQSEQRPNMQNVDLYKKMYNVFNHSYDALFDIYEQLNDISN